MSLQVIPLTTSPNQSYTIQIYVDGQTLTLNIDVRYNEMAGYWILTIKDASNNLILDSIPMVTGSYPAANILKQYAYLKIGAWYIVNVSNIQTVAQTNEGYGQGQFGAGGYGGSSGQGGTDYPDNTNLGTDFELWIDDTPS
jgi:hypothetical protein